MLRKGNYKALTLILTVILVFSIFLMASPAIINAATAWAPNTYYAVGAIVTYNGIDYQCLQAHTSLVGWEPPNVPALWKVVSGGVTPTITKTPTATKTPSGAATPTATKTPTSTPGSVGLVNNAIYRIEPACAPGKCLDVAGVGTADNTNVHIWTWVSGANQQWKAVDVGGGYWKFLPQHVTGKALDVAGAGNADNTNVVMYTDNGSNAQKWKLYDAGNGYIKLEPACAPGKVLDVYYGTNADGTNVEIYTALGNTAQQWKFYNVSGGSTPTPAATPTATRTPSSGGSNSVYSVAYSSIPAPGSSGGVSFTLLNGTNGAYSNSQIYWGVLGINPCHRTMVLFGFKRQSATYFQRFE